jgi:CDP-diacylglycerol--glycerol-3-phosphate 3-phosphatidyltransferase
VNLANLITSSRLLVSLGVIVCLEAIGDVEHPTLVQTDRVLIWTAFGLFMYAACSDFVDGWVARKYGQETQLGRVIDPFADKFLICGTMISMLQFADHHLEDELQSWMVVLIVSREFLVTTIRSVAEAHGIEFPADKLGKLKMVAQCTAVSAQLTMIAGTQIFAWFGFWFMWITIVLSVVSAIGYIIKARPVLSAK